jgi:hypothetical protein
VVKDVAYKNTYKDKLAKYSPDFPSLPPDEYLKVLQSCTFSYYQVLESLQSNLNQFHLKELKWKKNWQIFSAQYKLWIDKPYDEVWDEMYHLHGKKEGEGEEEVKWSETEQGVIKFLDEYFCEESQDKRKTPEQFYLETYQSITKSKEECETKYLNLLGNRNDHIQKLVKFETKNIIIARYSPKYVMENTPIGYVIMTYHMKDGVFQYYANRTISYAYLEVVARKFACMFDMRYVYVDMQAELDEQEALPESEKEATKIAKYLDGYHNKVKKNPNEKGFVPAAPPKLPKSVAIVKTNATPNTKKTLKSKSNTFVHIGRLNDFSPLPPRKATLVTKKQKLSYRDFKSGVPLD